MAESSDEVLEVITHLLESKGAPPHADSDDPLVRKLHQLYETQLAVGPGSSTFSFLASLSHELRTPLNAIIGYSELILDELDTYTPDVLEPDMKRIHHAGRHLLGLIDEVVDISRLESGSSQQLKETLDLATFVRGLVPTLQPVVQQRGNRFTWTVEPAVRLRIDAVKLRSILRTLVNRAARVTTQGTVAILAEQVDDEVILEIRDTGEPIPKAMLAGSPRHFSSGQGRGLATASRMVEVLGGRMQVESAGEGTVFRVVLPALDLPSEDEVPLPDLSDDERVILVVDDDPTVHDLLRRTLSPQGYTVLAARSGPVALRMVEAIVPALITLDVQMPEMDGWTTLARMKAIPKLADVPVVMMSMIDDEHAPVNLGASEYVVKPFERAGLLATVERLVGPQRRRVLVVDDEPDARELARRVLVSAGYLVDEVNDGAQAMAYLSQQRPDLILLDLMMPEMDGFEVIRALQADTTLAAIPLVVLTARTLTDADRRRLAKGARSVVLKGDAPQQVLERIQAALA